LAINPSSEQNVIGIVVEAMQGLSHRFRIGGFTPELRVESSNRFKVRCPDSPYLHAVNAFPVRPTCGASTAAARSGTDSTLRRPLDALVSPLPMRFQT
jgi:hypothetical protein